MIITKFRKKLKSSKLETYHNKRIKLHLNQYVFNCYKIFEDKFLLDLSYLKKEFNSERLSEILSNIDLYIYKDNEHKLEKYINKLAK